MLKKLWFEKEFTSYPHFTVYDFEAMLEELNEKPTDDLTFLPRHSPTSVAIYDTLSKEPVYLVDKNPERLIERFIEVLTQKHEEIISDILQFNGLQTEKIFHKPNLNPNITNDDNLKPNITNAALNPILLRMSLNNF